MGCCVMGCLRLILFQIWRLLLAALVALVLARIDGYIERRHGRSTAGRVWRAYRGQRKRRPPA